MYYVNVDQIELRTAVIPVLVEASNKLINEAESASGDHALPLLAKLAQERVLHLAIELVTDIGSLLIDGFLLRDASSYEDIIEILRVEHVFPEDLVISLQELVKLRKPLVQDYMTWETADLHGLIAKLPVMLPEFEACIHQFIAKELGLSN